MTTINTSKEKESRSVHESTGQPVWDDIPDVDERFDEISQEANARSRIEIVQETIMPKIKELEALKQGVYAVDLEKTIDDMFMVMKNMEAQLERVLRINSVLEKDLYEAKKMIAGLKEAKSQLERTIVRMETEAPSKRELQIEIDRLIEERNEVQTSIREVNVKTEKLQEAVIEHQKRSRDLEEEKSDLISEIRFLESRLDTAMERIAEYKDETNILKGENLTHLEKIKVLEEELNDTLDDKYRIMSELRSSKKAMAELHSALSDKKLQEKRSFYKGADDY
ncbi:MAG: hypothetical protein JSV01_01965 [Desulfobacterales bacterium]|nr:MAG: hypothetical protein JSV01_01965 [Desulfobacterales bacterium]